MLIEGATKSTWVTRRIPTDVPVTWVSPLDGTAIGDVLLCEVLVPCLHGRVETSDGSRSKLYQGDRIACALGNRYATSMLEGVGTASAEAIELLSASGVCGHVQSLADKSAKPTGLRVLGQGFVNGLPLNVRSFAMKPALPTGVEPSWVVVVGSSMDSGKTTACASLIDGLRREGRQVGAAKLTGTASTRDMGAFRDAGASPVVDFLDAGWPSTAGCSADQLRTLVRSLADELRGAGTEIGVLEIADGLLQVETEIVLGNLDEWVGSTAVILTVRESLSAIAGVQRLAELGHSVMAISGVVTSSPLACREVQRSGAGRCIPTSALGRELAPELIPVAAL